MIRGTLKDNLGNYGSSDSTVVAEYKNGKSCKFAMEF